MINLKDMQGSDLDLFQGTVILLGDSETLGHPYSNINYG
jgi:hypothetical protein